MSDLRSPENIDNRPALLEPFSRGERPSAFKMNQSIVAINKLFTGSSGVKNESKLNKGSQLYIATESKGIWDSGASEANGVIKVRPIRMELYNEDGSNNDVIGDEIEIPKFWDQEVEIDDIGIAVNMGSGVNGFYVVGKSGSGNIPIKNVSTATTPDIVAGQYLYIDDAEYDSGYLLTGRQPSAGYESRQIAFAVVDVDFDTIGSFKLWGSILAKVTVNSGSHEYARITDGEHSLQSTEFPTRFKIINKDVGDDLTQMFVSPPNPHYTTAYISGSTTTVEGKLVHTATTVDGANIKVLPSPSVNPENWDGKTINGVTYTDLGSWSRNASPTVGSDWTENLFPPYQTNEITGILPNEFDDTTNKEIPYVESGTNKVWVKTCT